MIKHLRIENFRGLREVAFDLEPLTVLVGPNGSGKSSVLKALTSWGTVALDPRDCRNHDTSAKVRVEVTRTDGSAAGGACRANQRPSGVVDASLLQLDIGLLRQTNQAQHADRLNPNGGNLVNAFHSLGRAVEEQAAQLFAKLVPLFKDVDVRPTNAGHLGFFLTDRWNPTVTYSPDQVSDGTMLVLAYLTVLHQRNAPDLLAIEEPERGLHPYLLRELIALLRKLSAGEHRMKPTQVVLATHSAELLNFVEPREVRFMDRSGEDGSVVVHAAPIDAPDWRKSVEAFDGSLGGMWLSGGLGGVPGS